MKWTSWIVVVSALICLNACSNRSSPTTAEHSRPTTEAVGARNAAGKADSTPGIHRDKDAEPPAIVLGFLEAAKHRDRDVAEQLLTKAARRETRREGLTIDPPGTPGVSYEVESVEILADNPSAAYVKIRWLESNAQTDAAEIIWILRKESQGWRIAGMSTPQEDGQFTTWNFEEPADVQEIRRQVSVEPDETTDGAVRPASSVLESPPGAEPPPSDDM